MLTNSQYQAGRERYNDIVRDSQRYHLAHSSEPAQAGLIHKYVLSVVKRIRRQPKLNVPETVGISHSIYTLPRRVTFLNLWP